MLASIKSLIKKKEYDKANDLIVNQLSPAQRVEYAIFAAELALPIFEKEYPKDKRLRQTVDAAKAWLKNPCQATVGAAYKASEAAYKASEAAKDAAYAAVAASAAWSAARAALYAAWEAAGYAEYAAWAIKRAAQAGVPWETMLEYGIELLTPNSIRFVMEG